MTEKTWNTLMADKLVKWYEKNKRELPWRDTGNPFDVWISEIMCQQTRIEAVIPKFIHFRSVLTDIDALADCDDDVLFRLWEGLGYYARARNLKKCACILKEAYASQLPKTYAELVRLSGFGPYTAGAVASIAFGEHVPAIDGNVMRVIARLFAISNDVRDPSSRKIFEACLKPVYEDSSISASSFNQGLMELGQVVCTPGDSPHCEWCPLSEYCEANRLNLMDQLPYRSSLNPRKNIDRTICVIKDGTRFILHKRPSKGLLAGLYEFIGLDGRLPEKDVLQAVEKMGLEPVHIRKLPSSKHVFTHREWHMTAFEITVTEIDTLPEDCIAVTREELQNIAIPSAFRTYLDWYSLREGSKQ